MMWWPLDGIEYEKKPSVALYWNDGSDQYSYYIERNEGWPAIITCLAVRYGIPVLYSGDTIQIQWLLAVPDLVKPVTRPPPDDILMTIFGWLPVAW